jgi:hypothetical protein
MNEKKVKEIIKAEIIISKRIFFIENISFFLSCRCVLNEREKPRATISFFEGILTEKEREREKQRHGGDVANDNRKTNLVILKIPFMI